MTLLASATRPSTLLTSAISKRSASAAVIAKWKKASLYGVPPVVIVTFIFVYQREKAHWDHYKRPEYKQYPWLSQRTRPFPWEPTGKKTLFHNPHLNAIPGIGYEAEFKKPWPFG